MNNPFNPAMVAAAFILCTIAFALIALAIFVIHLLLTLPMRRSERARLFLDLVEGTLNDGRPLEESLIAISKTGETAVGLRFHLLAASLEKGVPFGEALEKVPRFLPPKVMAMLRAGLKLGDVRKVLPACRQMLKDAVSEATGAVPYIFAVTLFTTPIGLMIFVLISPKLMEIALAYEAPPFWPSFVFGHASILMALQEAVLAGLTLGAFLYIGGPRVVGWFPVLDRVHYRLPWRRKRLQRDFSTVLAILLDSAVPEPEAVRLAAASTANAIFRRRAERTVQLLAEGMPLPHAVQALDDSGEFRWRLRNACHSGGGFLASLAGWHASLDAQAFRQEQAASHTITTALVLWNGFFVAVIVLSVFMVLISIINVGVLW